MKTAQATLTGLLRGDKLHARIDDIKRAKGAPPWSEKIVVNDQIVSTLICQPPGHPNDRHYHLVDEWWLVVEGEIDWEIEGQAEPVRARPVTSSSSPRTTSTISGRRAPVRRSASRSPRRASSIATSGSRARGRPTGSGSDPCS